MKKSYRQYIGLLVFCCFFTNLWAQQKTVSGQVTDTLQNPIPGVNVLLKGQHKGTLTDIDGAYTLVASPHDTLVFSYLGFQTREIAVKKETIINVQLREQENTLGQVVINAGYYTTTEKSRTGSIARITNEEIEKQPINNPLAAMQGRMAGVDIVQASGVPGGGFEVRIRGQNSIMAGNEPLYIIDGVPYDNTSLSSSGTSGPIITGANVSPLNAISPDAIASIEVLKDADATAIYGSRGANGVVLITTKKGSMGKTRFEVNARTGIAHTTRMAELLNTQQYLEMRREAFANDGITEYPALAYDVNGTWEQDRHTDWQEELIGGTAQLQQLGVAISGGNAHTQFRLSGMAQKETTVYPGDYEYGRISTHAHLSHSGLEDRFKANFTAGYTLEDNLLPDQDYTLQALNLPPNAPALYDEEGALNWEDNTWTNPLAKRHASYQQHTKSFLSNLSLSYQLTEHLTAKTNMGYGHILLEDFSLLPHTIYNPAFGLDSNSSSIITNDSHREYWILEPQLEWQRSWGKHKATLLVGSTFQEKSQQSEGLLGLGFAHNSFMHHLGAAQTLMVLEGARSNYKYHSVFGRANYSYDDKLFLNITGRRDGSSRFGAAYKYGNFGALGAAWLFSEDLQLSWLDFGKLRGSYGLTGNDQIGDYGYMRNYVIGDYPYGSYPGLLPARHYNPHFRWEENIKKEIALELGFWQQRLHTSVGYYNNRSSNQLVDYALPGTTGFTSILSNLDALVENSGWELELRGSPLRKKELEWDVSLNLSLPRNKLLAFPGLENSTYAHRYVIGEPLQVVKLYRLEGVNHETGLFEFKDYNGDGELTEEDREYLADLSPQLFGGLSNSLSYRNWSMAVFLQFVKKDGYNPYRFSSTPGSMNNQPVTVMDRWQQPGDQASMQRFTTGADPEATAAYDRFKQSSGIVSDASFVRLKTLALSYSLPLKGKRTRCRISLQGQNLLTLTDFPTGDPEQVRGFIPPLRRIMLGTHLSF